MVEWKSGREETHDDGEVSESDSTDRTEVDVGEDIETDIGLDGTTSRLGRLLDEMSLLLSFARVK